MILGLSSIIYDTLAEMQQRNNIPRIELWIRYYRQNQFLPNIFFTGETRRMNLCQAVNSALHTTLANDPTSSK
jgi:hypothetical protein